MAHLAHGASSTASSPLLDCWTPADGLLVDPDAGSLKFKITDVSTEDLECDPVTVIPLTTVNMTTDRIGTGLGHFAAVFVVPNDASVGAHEIEWTWTYNGAAFTYRQRFDILPAVPKNLPHAGYILVSDLRAHGFDANTISNVRALKLIASQSAYIDLVCERVFVPTPMDMKIDGSGSRVLLVGQPIIALSSLLIGDDALTLVPTDVREVVIYNRHLSGMLSPDDRHAPRLELRDPFPLPGEYFSNGYVSMNVPVRLAFSRNCQNVRIRGIFGYTDPDGSPLGKTPEGIRQAALLLVARNGALLSDTEADFDAKYKNRVTGMVTADQSITFSPKGLGEGAFTSDIEIDRLLEQYRAPMRIFSA